MRKAIVYFFGRNIKFITKGPAMNNANSTGADTGNTTSTAKVPAPKETGTPYNAMDMSDAQYKTARAALVKQH
jgi:hypothetical protein